MGFGAIIGGIGSMWAASKSAKAQQRAAESGAAASLEQTRMGIEAQKEMQQEAMDYTDRGLVNVMDIQDPFYKMGMQSAADLHFIISGREPDQDTLIEMYGVGSIDRQIELLSGMQFSDDEYSDQAANSKLISDLRVRREAGMKQINQGYKLPDYQESEAYKYKKEKGEDDTLAYLNKMGFAGSRMEANTMKDFYSQLNAEEEQLRISRLGAESAMGQNAANVMSGNQQSAGQAMGNMFSYGQQTVGQLYGQAANAASQGAAAEGAAQAGLYNSYSNMFGDIGSYFINKNLTPQLPNYKRN